MKAHAIGAGVACGSGSDPRAPSTKSDPLRSDEWRRFDSCFPLQRTCAGRSTIMMDTETKKDVRMRPHTIRRPRCASTVRSSNS